VAADFARDGFAMIAPVLSAAECDDIIDGLGLIALAGAGSRTLMSMASIRNVADRLTSSPSVAALLPPDAIAVQCTLFAKSDDQTWSVTPHQDLSIPVRERVDLPGWGGWSLKEGRWFVQPPVAVLASLVAVRLQLDGNAADTGPLDVVPGTHRLGRLAQADILGVASRGTTACVVERGGVVVLRPLIVHSSTKGRMPGHRRVLHFVFGAPLPDGVDWPDYQEMPTPSELP
jgi:hypothetical protein